MSREPHRDWRSELGRHEARAAHEVFGDQMSLFRLLLRVITLPFWLPFKLLKVIRRRRELRTFVSEKVRNRLVNESLSREIALAWVEEHPQEYFYGEYDPGFRKLHLNVKGMIERNRR
jgi:hypothetical protein